MASKETISAAELRRFAMVLKGLGRIYSELADWLEEQNVREIPGGGGTPTVRRAMGYLGGFTGTVLKAYAKAHIEGRLPVDARILAGLSTAEASAKHAAVAPEDWPPERQQSQDEDDALGEFQKAVRQGKSWPEMLPTDDEKMETEVGYAKGRRRAAKKAKDKGKK
jgi:hypothetical protein